MAKEDFINIQEDVRFSRHELEEIRENPKGLTKEGCLMEIRNWANSRNRKVLIKYLAMLKKCNNFTSSGKTQGGKQILARQKNLDGSKKVWTEDIDVQKLEDFAESKMKELKRITKKGE